MWSVEARSVAFWTKSILMVTSTGRQEYLIQWAICILHHSMALLPVHDPVSLVVITIPEQEKKKIFQKLFTLILWTNNSIREVNSTIPTSPNRQKNFKQFVTEHDKNAVSCWHRVLLISRGMARNTFLGNPGLEIIIVVEGVVTGGEKALGIVLLPVTA